jgi:hypothetical protein
MVHLLNLSLSYTGNDAEEHQLDFYDAAQALIGFERSLALTTHLALNGSIITQAPSLKGAKIFVVPPEAGSWTIAAAIVTGVSTAAYMLGTAPRDTPVGHLVSSLYDYVIRRTLGFPVDYDKSLAAQFAELGRQGADVKEITAERVDSLIEKTEPAIKMIHRPIVESGTAQQALITGSAGASRYQIGAPLTIETYNRMQIVERSREEPFEGRVSSYNINTFRGRIYIGDEQRPIPFELADSSRDDKTVAAVARSLARNAATRHPESNIEFRALKITTQTGRLKTLIITDVA